jgi:hypothetical protein
MIAKPEWLGPKRPMNEEKKQEGHVIWKFPLHLDIGQRQEARIPKGAQVLTAQIQGSQLCIWILCPQTLEMEVRFFEVWGTGVEMPPAPREYIWTAVIGPGLVLHVFEAT